MKASIFGSLFCFSIYKVPDIIQTKYTECLYPQIKAALTVLVHMWLR